MKYYKDLSNQRFGKLTAISFIPGNKETRRKSSWNCTCDCGNNVIMKSGILMKKFIHSCGCSYLGEPRLKNNAIFRRYRSNAKVRNLSFNIDHNFFDVLINSNCYYCGTSPSNKYRNIVYSGIDRLDNSLGYETDNCVSCCKICNIMKKTMHVFDFLSHVIKISTRVAQRDKPQDIAGG